MAEGRAGADMACLRWQGSLAPFCLDKTLPNWRLQIKLHYEADSFMYQGQEEQLK